MMPFLFATVFSAFGCLGALGTPGGVQVSAPATSGWAWPAIPLAVTDAQMGGWVLTLFAVCSGVGALTGVAAFFRPQPALHKQFADREDHDNDVKEIKESIASLKAEFTDWSSGHHAARRRMHKKINHLSTAMAYLAGTLESTQPNAARRIRELLTTTEEEDDSE